MKKNEMVKSVLENIKENEYDSRELLYDLARQRLESMTKKDLKNTYFSEK